MAEFQEAWADPARQPGTQAVEEPLEGEKTECGDEQDQLAEGIHGHLREQCRDRLFKINKYLNEQ